MPDASFFAVRKIVSAVGNVCEGQVELQHERATLELACLGVLEGPCTRGEVVYDVQGLLDERVCVFQLLLGAFAQCAGYTVVLAQRRGPDEIEGVFGIARGVSLQDVGACGGAALWIDVQGHHFGPLAAKGPAYALRA